MDNALKDVPDLLVDGHELESLTLKEGSPSKDTHSERGRKISTASTFLSASSTGEFNDWASEFSWAPSLLIGPEAASPFDDDELAHLERVVKRDELVQSAIDTKLR